MAEDGTRMTISEHLEELRQRLIRCLLAVAVGFGLAFWRIREVVEFLRGPLGPALEKYGDKIKIVQSKAFEGFLGSMKVALFAGLVLAAPVILYQIWAFVGAGLYKHERRVVKYYATPGFLLFFLGAFLSYAFVMPWALEFLIGWSVNELDVDSLLSFGSYITLVAFALFMFGMIFQLPVIMVFLMRVGVVEPDTFKRYRRHAIVANFALAMILTPPDVVSQIAMAICMTLLYESAILIGSTIAKPRETG